MDDGHGGGPSRMSTVAGPTHSAWRAAAAWRRLAVILAVAILAAACASGAGSTDEAGGDVAADEPSEPAVQPRSVIRFAYAPDPLFTYLKDTGELAAWEERHDLRIVTTESWDAYDYFRGGHGDVASLATYELPVLEEDAGIKVVAFGKLNHQRTPLFRNASDRFDTLEDVPDGATVCANSGLTNTIAWSVIADQLHGIDYRLGEGKFNMVLQGHYDMPALVQSNECTIAAAIPEAAAPQLRKGQLEMMYGGRAPWKIYQDDICRCEHKGVMSNLLVARQEWYDAHPDQAAAFLELWERGLELWRQNKEEIVALYPETFFPVEAEEDTEYMLDYINDNDWYANTVYMDEAWIDEEKKLYNYMIESGWMQQNAEIPQFEAVAPPAQ
jgi:ABC-type nitrate/sulfonate/bicarbonate transport system substrate-binding protein